MTGRIELMWVPWQGALYNARRLLILGESCYDVINESQEYEAPPSDHPIRLVKDQLMELPKEVRFMRMVTRALAGEHAPAADRVQEAWRSVAFTNYVPTSVGTAAKVKQPAEGWQLAKVEWPGLLELLRPRSVIILGYKTWHGLPDTDLSENDDQPFSSDPRSVTERWRGYKLTDGSVVRCWSHWHPAAGASWESIRDAIHKAEATSRSHDWDPA